MKPVRKLLRSKPEVMSDQPEPLERKPERLQKVLAAAGIASRRASEELIGQGRVEVNGKIVTELGTRVDPSTDDIRIDGEPLPKVEQYVYYLVNKPIGVLSTASDERGRKTVLDILGDVPQRVYPVGRLDAESEGLLLLTNDGTLTERLTHPRYGHTREYRVLVRGIPKEQTLQKLRRGVVLDDGPTGPAEVELLPPPRLRAEHLPYAEGNTAWLLMIIREGRKRQIRRMLELSGHRVRRLIRVAMGPLRLGTLPEGEYRPLTATEIELLRRSVEPDGEKRRRTEGAPVRHTPATPRPTPVGRAGAPRRKPTGGEPASEYRRSGQRGGSPGRRSIGGGRKPPGLPGRPTRPKSNRGSKR